MAEHRTPSGYSKMNLMYTGDDTDIINMVNMTGDADHTVQLSGTTSGDLLIIPQSGTTTIQAAEIPATLQLQSGTHIAAIGLDPTGIFSIPNLLMLQHSGAYESGSTNILTFNVPNSETTIAAECQLSICGVTSEGCLNQNITFTIMRTHNADTLVNAVISGSTAIGTNPEFTLATEVSGETTGAQTIVVSVDCVQALTITYHTIGSSVGNLINANI
jgi:hypothetical protein